MLRVLTLKWHAVGPQVEVAEPRIPDICTVNPELFGQRTLPRSDAEACELARFIATAPKMFALLDEWVMAGDAPPEAVAIVKRFG